jgi:hypothetical protein
VRDGDKLAGLMDCCPLPLPLTIGLLGQEWCQAILSKLFNPQQNQSLYFILKKIFATAFYPLNKRNVFIKNVTANYFIFIYHKNIKMGVKVDALIWTQHGKKQKFFSY